MVKTGQRIRLIEMDDPEGIPPGTEGTVTSAELIYLGAPQQFWQISVEWDNGYSLMVCYPPDKFVEVDGA